MRKGYFAETVARRLERLLKCQSRTPQRAGQRFLLD